MRFFNATGIAETCSTASLYFIAMPLKYIGGNEILVQVIGPIHGVLWSLYIGLLGLGWLKKEWNMRAVILGGFLSFPRRTDLVGTSIGQPRIFAKYEISRL